MSRYRALSCAPFGPSWIPALASKGRCFAPAAVVWPADPPHRNEEFHVRTRVLQSSISIPDQPVRSSGDALPMHGSDRIVSPWLQTLADYVELLKPRIMVLLL